MRGLLLLAGLYAATSANAQTSAPTALPGEITVTGRTTAELATIEGGRTFISLKGEPFRSTDALSGAEHCFAQADVDHDRRLTPQEFRADALRFFRTLDTDRDDLLGPEEIEHYETEVAPEVRAMSTYGDPPLVKTDQDGNVTEAPYPMREIVFDGSFGRIAAADPIAIAAAVLSLEYDEGPDPALLAPLLARHRLAASASEWLACLDEVVQRRLPCA